MADTLGHAADSFSDKGRNPDGHGHPLIRVSSCPEPVSGEVKLGKFAYLTRSANLFLVRIDTSFAGFGAALSATSLFFHQRVRYWKA